MCVERAHGNVFFGGLRFSTPSPLQVREAIEQHLPLAGLVHVTRSARDDQVCGPLCVACRQEGFWIWGCGSLR
jgi:hypothetical protein